jgi:hypothetical protein
MVTRNSNEAANPKNVAPKDIIALPDRDPNIAKLAYYKAEKRGFEPGYELDDWLAVENEYVFL